MAGGLSMIMNAKDDRLPSPRLELKWEKIGDSWLTRECHYSLVIPLRRLDIRHTGPKGNPTETVLEIGVTRVTGGTGKPVFNDRVIHRLEITHTRSGIKMR